MATDRKNKFPPLVRERLEKSGYFTLSKEERMRANSKCLQVLESVPNPDYLEGKKILDEMRGGNSC